MHQKELYINNQLVDLPANFSIGLNFGCSDVNDLNNILTDYSSTINLPLTTNNNRIIELSLYPVSGSVLPYNFIDARYYVSGIPIFENGKAVIMDITGNSISINLFWSVFNKLNTLENLLLSDLSISESFVNNYRTTPYDGTYLQQLIADFGNTFSLPIAFGSPNIINRSRLFPVFKVKPIFDLILGGSTAYTMPSSIISHLQKVRICTGTRKGNSTITAATKIETSHNISGLSRLVPLGYFSYRLNYFNDCNIGSDVYSLVREMDYEGGANIPANSKFMAAPAKGLYRVHGSIAVNPAAFKNSSDYIHPILHVYSLPEGFVEESETVEPTEEILLSIDFGELTRPMVGFPVSATFDEQIELSGYNQTLRLVFETATNIPVAQTDRPVLASYSGSWGIKETEININYIDTDNNIGFLLPYPAKENLPEMSQKDFVKSIMQLYSLMMVIKDNKPYFFRFDEVINNISIAKDWTDKLVNNNNPLIPAKLTFDLGVAKKNYLKYAPDEAVNEMYGRGVIASDYSIVQEKTVVQQSKFAASKDVVISSLGVQLTGLLMQQFVNKDGVIKYEGKAKPRIGYEYTGNKIELSDFNIYNEDNFSQHFTAAKSFRFKGHYPGAGLDYSFDLSSFFVGYRNSIETGKKLVLKFRLNSIDLHEIDYTIPVWLSQFNRYFFVKKISGWDAGVNCEVELIQLP